MLAFDRLLEMEYLETARATDIRYHQAKLINLAQWDGEALHTEHKEYRASLLTSATPQLSRDELEAQILRHFQRSRTTGAH